MSYTVNEVAKISGVTIKTLYHYQKISIVICMKASKPVLVITSLQLQRCLRKINDNLKPY